MRASRIQITVFCTLLAVAIFVSAQTRKPGLWELTTTTTWQQSPFPAGSLATNSAPHTIQVCLTQQQIDKYGAVTPARPGCQITNVVNKPNGMTADMVCTGRMSGKGTLESKFDGDHATGSIHFAGTMQIGPDTKPIVWSSASTSVFKSSDCGDVKPLPMPDK